MDEEICDQFQQFVWDEITRQGLFGLATADIEFNKNL